MTHANLTTIPSLIHTVAQAYPHAAALRGLDRPALTFTQATETMKHVASQLRSAGVKRGDAVAIVLPNGPEAAMAFLTVASAATAAPLNPSYRQSEFDFYLSDLNAAAMLVPAGDEGPAVAAARAHGIAVLHVETGADQPAGAFTLQGVRPTPDTALDACDENDVALVLHTSGTTSRPKMVPLTHANLCVSANSIRTSLALSPEDLCLNVMPLFHIHGLVAALLSSLSAGAGVACMPGFVATEFLGWIERMAPTWYTAVPTMHQAIAAQAAALPQIAQDAKLRLIRSSSSALPPQVMSRIEELFHCPMIEAYGMTEASHQMCSNPLPPAKRQPGSVGVPAGPRVAIMDAQGNLLAAGQTGEVVIQGHNVTRGYVANDKANAEAFTQGWFRTGDQGYMDGEGYLFLTGRLKELINRGGEKIAPREVDEALLDHPAVKQAVAFAVPHPVLGEEVAAAVVLEAGADDTESALRRFAAMKLADFKVPRRIIIVDEIPKGPTGKLQRIGLAQKLGVTAEELSATRPPFVKPATATEQVLAQTWKSVLKVERVGRDDHFFQLGRDSNLAARVAVAIKDALGIELEMIAFFETPLLREMAKAIDDAVQPTGAPGDDLAALLDEVEALSDEQAAAKLKHARTDAGPAGND